MQGVTLKDCVTASQPLTAAQLCSSDVQCVPATGGAGGSPASGKLSFNLSPADDTSLSVREATALVASKCGDDAMKSGKTARSVRLFLLLRVRARRRAADGAFRQHWQRMRMKALSVLGSAERSAAISAPLPTLNAVLCLAGTAATARLAAWLFCRPYLLVLCDSQGARRVTIRAVQHACSGAAPVLCVP